LPVLQGFRADDRERIQTALELLKDWEISEAGGVARIAALRWDQRIGYQAVVSYPMRNPGQPGRTLVTVGQNFDVPVILPFHELARVFRYLGERGIAVNQVLISEGKKVVVKTRGRS